MLWRWLNGNFVSSCIKTLNKYPLHENTAFLNHSKVPLNPILKGQPEAYRNPTSKTQTPYSLFASPITCIWKLTTFVNRYSSGMNSLPLLRKFKIHRTTHVLSSQEPHKETRLRDSDCPKSPNRVSQSHGDFTITIQVSPIPIHHCIQWLCH